MNDFSDSFWISNDGMPHWLPDDTPEKYINYKKFLSVEIGLTPSKYLPSDARYLRAKLTNNELDSVDIDLEIMHDKYNNNDPLALEVYCNGNMIGYVQKFNNRIDINDFCFNDNKKIDSLKLEWENNKFILSKSNSSESKSEHDAAVKAAWKQFYKDIEKPVDTSEDWMAKLWKWADANKVTIHDLPRDGGAREADLSCLELEELPKEIGNLTSLYYFNLLSNNLTKLPAEIGNLIHLDQLILSNNKLEELPKEIGNLTNLIELDLDNNQLSELPKEIWNLTNLTKLSLNMNQLVELPAEIGNLTNLTELTLSRNKLRKLPKEIGNLTNLTKLYLGENQLVELPKEIGNLTNLTRLYFDSNLLTELPKEIDNLIKINRLS